MKIKNTKRALLMSALSLMLCVSMLIGSTFAWFTDSVTSAGNRIQSGKLEIDLVDADGNSLEGEMIEWAAFDGRGQDQILWEPGCTYNTEEFYIENKGNLNLKFKFDVTGITGDEKLLEVIDFSCMAQANWFNFNTGSVSISTDAEFDMLEGVDIDTFFYGVYHFDEYVLEPGQKVGPFVLTGHMDEEAGNEYQNLSIENIAITLLATQATGEEDSFNGVYDALAVYPGLSSGKLEENQSAVEIPVTDGSAYVLGSAVVPAEAIADPAKDVEAKIVESNYVGNFTVETGLTAIAYEITVSNLKENNDVPVKVEINLPAGLDPATFKLYHYDEEIPYTYDPTTGDLTFESATFSPFTVVYDPDSKYEPTNPEGSDLPNAVVTATPEYVNVDLPWGSYGAWSPTAGLDSKLEAAYKFACVDTVAEANKSPYAAWDCDFYVKLDRDLAANQIFLGGNYGSFGWVGFHNGDLTLEANTEIPLLGSVSGGWTYAEVVANVGEFVCGVGDVNNALSGATFTVMLRLTNPEDASEFYNVATINYTFE